jgi:hypothetical protein
VTEALPHPTALTRQKAEIQRDFLLIEQRGCSDPTWHFKIGVRRGSLAGPIGPEAPTSEEPRSLALFHRDEPPASVEVIGVLLAREVDPADYLDCLLEAEGKTVVSRKPVKMLGGVIGDAVATWTVDGAAYAGRFFATKWGPRLFVLCFRTERRRYEALAEDFFVSISTFSVFDDSLGLFAEKVLTVSNAVPIPWRAVVPESWVIKPEPDAGNRAASFQATQVPALPSPELNVLFGKLSFAVADRSEAKGGRAAANAYLEAVRDAGVNIEHDKFVEEETSEPYEKSWLLITKAAKGSNPPGELRCRVLMHKRVWVIAGVLGPTRETNALAWMQNKRTLDLVTSNLRLKP